MSPALAEAAPSIPLALRLVTDSSAELAPAAGTRGDDDGEKSQTVGEMPTSRESEMMFAELRPAGRQPSADAPRPLSLALLTDASSPSRPQPLRNDDGTQTEMDWTKTQGEIWQKGEVEMAYVAFGPLSPLAPRSRTSSARERHKPLAAAPAAASFPRSGEASLAS
jgi:hypothetical protein